MIHLLLCTYDTVPFCFCIRWNIEMVENITMDFSDCMRTIAREAFPEATVIRDCFYVVKRGEEGCEEIHLRLKREVVKDMKRQKAEFRKLLENLAAQRKTYRERMRKKHGRNCCMNFTILGCCKVTCYKQSMSREKWNAMQEKRAKILFAFYPRLEEAYNQINSL